MRILKKILLWTCAALILIVGGATFTGWWLSAPIPKETLAELELSPNHKDGKFVNIEPEAGIELSWERVSELFQSYDRQEPVGAFPVVSIPAERFNTPPEPGLRLSWFGHASVLIEIDGYRVMTDPVLSDRASPFSFAGPTRFHQPPIALEDLRGIDAVVISHNHYDHMDKATVTHLANQGTRFFVPIGNRDQLLSWDVPPEQVTALDWWQGNPVGDLQITATPARHYSSRGTFDYQETLWAFWVISGPTASVFFSGDTGYSPEFIKVGSQFGPFDATIIKIGTYGPGQMWYDIHMPPEESLQVHQDVGGKALLPVHWATFDLGNHEWDEPIIRTLKAADHFGVRVLTPKVGAFVQPEDVDQENWWEDLE